ncbi:MAG: glycerophosphodiester phosphodiesterase family protein [Pseudomonadota bacterium]|nr:glycerophosphodiester phosphodiesterase family protein [Pseudomonadota bacterium]
MPSYPRLIPLVSALALTGAATAQPVETGAFKLEPDGNLSAMLDCFEASGKTLISAHRGGPSAGLPENGIETMDAFLAASPAVMEVDVVRSADGVHYLMHDRTLDRTTTGSGNASEANWPDVRELNLVDEAGWVTPYKVPSLEAALEWADGKTVLQLDFKRSADYAEVIEMVRDKNMASSVILIAYSVDQATRLHSLAPEMLISFSVQSQGDLDEVIAAGVPADRIVAFTGTRLPRPDLYSALDRQDVEVIFGSLGRSRNSLDNVIGRFGTDERYVELSRGGVDLLATDRGREAAIALGEAGRLPVAGECGVSRINGS